MVGVADNPLGMVAAAAVAVVMVAGTPTFNPSVSRPGMSLMRRGVGGVGGIMYRRWSPPLQGTRMRIEEEGMGGDTMTGMVGADKVRRRTRGRGRRLRWRGRGTMPHPHPPKPHRTSKLWAP